MQANNVNLTNKVKEILEEVIPYYATYFNNKKFSVFIREDGLFTNIVGKEIPLPVDEPTLVHLDQDALFTKSGKLRKAWKVKILDMSPLTSMKTSALTSRGGVYKNSKGILVAGELYLNKGSEVATRLKQSIYLNDPTFKRMN